MSANIGIIGLGRWGKQLVRVFNQESTVRICCNRSTLNDHFWLNEHYPHIEVTFDLPKVLDESSVDAVAIATPVDSHADIARQALLADKHVFLEKPLATSSHDAAQLVELAEKRDRILFVGHTFLYDDLFDSLMNATGPDPPKWGRSVWWKFGTFDSDLEWNLLSHEIAIALKLMRWQTSDVRARVIDHRSGRTALDFLHLQLYDRDHREWWLEIDRFSAFSAHKVRVITSNGRRFAWDDNKLFEARAAEWQTIATRSTEPLVNEVRSFLSLIQKPPSRELRDEHQFNVEVVRAIEMVAEGTRSRVGQQE